MRTAVVTQLPGIAAVLWDSLLVQARVFFYALDDGDPLGMVRAGAQALILMLQTLGVSYLLYALARRLLGAILRRGVKLYRGAV